MGPEAGIKFVLWLRRRAKDLATLRLNEDLHLPDIFFGELHSCVSPVSYDG